ncbi:MAG: amino acid racemase [Phenylobacterium sp.]|jgi:aspartate racemase|uniref:aspartate/glutamate racemase family protein n=1 Tax=Phenylobacterium sp. TaxID=1871053 RepID=UPI0025E400B4|nr:amino acid racemase [Phenylobacterium sp.]MCA3709882.1 amino acid racemase [Phenylobacterium sp.]MCA3715817.1 amino acid racemase [Phenylobacterium sp.]MCA3724385.1 amino acid racemase [Phenylobacterium sp.]MCA3728632.1 amino acid racemase [Phenylobacterium sp.]MCA3731124.1 amino acid racemase [Phenylobacterium sp.]
MSRVLGVLGGMGPAATLDFLGKLQALTPVERDEDHIRVIVDINPQIPDRNDPFARPGPVLAEMAGGLQGAGAQVLAIACDTAHVHADLISRASGLPLVDMIETASRAARDSGARRAGVLGARDAVRLYHEYIAAQGMGLVTLPRDDQARFMDLVGRIKAGDLGAAVREGMRQLAEVLVREGAEAVIAGCTEVPLVLDPGDVRAPLIDAGEELARRCVSVCLGLEPLPQGR